MLTLKPAAACRWDLVSLGEVMLRFDPGDERIHTARTFRVWEGGGEYNVARALATCFGLRTSHVTALADNPIGRLVEDLMRQGGVDRSHLRWVEYDGIGRAARNGLYFAERGFGLRAPRGCTDRAHTAVSQLAPADVDWERIFDGEGARWFHTGGIFAGLSPTTPAVARAAMQAARRHGAIVSYDQTYRESLWRARGGKPAADAVNRELIACADVLLGAGRDAERLAREFPHLQLVATTLPRVQHASLAESEALGIAGGRTWRARDLGPIPVLDRIGAGDGFAAGLIAALLAGHDLQHALDCGAVHGALVMTTPGDSSMATRAEVEALMRGGRAEIAR